jgi:hypothetical protein
VREGIYRIATGRWKNSLSCWHAGPTGNRGPGLFPCWSWYAILGLYFLELDMQMGFECLNLKCTAGVALSRAVSIGCQSFLTCWERASLWARAKEQVVNGCPKWKWCCYGLQCEGRMIGGLEDDLWGN